MTTKEIAEMFLADIENVLSDELTDLKQVKENYGEFTAELLKQIESRIESLENDDEEDEDEDDDNS